MSVELFNSDWVAKSAPNCLYSVEEIIWHGDDKVVIYSLKPEPTWQDNEKYSLYMECFLDLFEKVN